MRKGVVSLLSVSFAAMVSISFASAPVHYRKCQAKSGAYIMHLLTTKQSHPGAPAYWLQPESGIYLPQFSRPMSELPFSYTKWSGTQSAPSYLMVTYQSSYNPPYKWKVWALNVDNGQLFYGNITTKYSSFDSWADALAKIIDSAPVAYMAITCQDN